MNYPDGKLIKIDDHVIWNEGTCCGIVVSILEHPDDFKKYSLAAPGNETKMQLCSYGPSEKGIFLSCNNDADLMKEDVFCSESDFEDDGLVLKKRGV